MKRVYALYRVSTAKQVDVTKDDIRRFLPVFFHGHFHEAGPAHGIKLEMVPGDPCHDPVYGFYFIFNDQKLHSRLLPLSAVCTGSRSTPGFPCLSLM